MKKKKQGKPKKQNQQKDVMVEIEAPLSIELSLNKPNPEIRRKFPYLFKYKGIFEYVSNFLENYKKKAWQGKNLIIKNDLKVEARDIAECVVSYINQVSNEIIFDKNNLIHIEDCSKKKNEQLLHEILRETSKTKALVLHDIAKSNIQLFEETYLFTESKPLIVIIVLKKGVSEKSLTVVGEVFLDWFKIINLADKKDNHRIPDDKFKQLCKEVEKECPRKLASEKAFFKELSKMSNNTKYDESGRGYTTWQSAKKRYYQVFPSKKANQ